MSDDQKGHEHGGGDHENPAGKQHDIASAIHAFLKKYEASQTSDDAKHNETLDLGRRTFKAIVIYSLLTALIAGAGIGATFIARDTEHRQLRAYLGIVIPNPSTNNITPPTIPIVSLGIKNTGQTPAYRAVVLSCVQLGPYPLPENQDFSCPNVIAAGIPQGPVTIFPGSLDSLGIRVVMKRSLTQAEFDSIGDGSNNRFYIWGKIQYVDAFNSGHYTNFCFSYFNYTETSGQIEVCNEHNDSD
jgi:hypothetical protein